LSILVDWFLAKSNGTALVIFCAVRLNYYYILRRIQMSTNESTKLSEIPDNLLSKAEFFTEVNAYETEISKEQAVETLKNDICSKTFCDIGFKNEFLKTCTPQNLKTMYIAVLISKVSTYGVTWFTKNYMYTGKDYYEGVVNGERVTLRRDQLGSSYSGNLSNGQAVTFDPNSSNPAESYTISLDGKNGEIKHVSDKEYIMHTAAFEREEYAVYTQIPYELKNFDYDREVVKKSNVYAFGKTFEGEGLATKLLKEKFAKANHCEVKDVRFFTSPNYTYDKLVYYPIYEFDCGKYSYYVDAITGTIMKDDFQRNEEYKQKCTELKTKDKSTMPFRVIMGIISMLCSCYAAGSIMAHFIESMLNDFVPDLIFPIVIAVAINAGAQFLAIRILNFSPRKEAFIAYEKEHNDMKADTPLSTFYDSSDSRWYYIKTFFKVFLINAAIMALMGICAALWGGEIFTALFAL